MKWNELIQSLRENIVFVMVCILVVAALAVISAVIERFWLKDRVVRPGRTRYIAYCGMFGAIAMLLHIFDFPVLMIAPGFYKLDFSEIPVMIGAFLLGPAGGVVIECVKILLKLVVKGTSTAFVGDLANFVVGCSFVIPASVLYHIHKTRKNAWIGLVAGTLCMTVFGSIFNAVYLLPAFSALYGIPLEAIIEMGASIRPGISNVWTFAAFAVAPLNLLKGILISVPTMLLYKRISNVLRVQVQSVQSTGI